MKLSAHATVTATRADRIARRVGRPRPGAAFAAALAALPALAHAGDRGATHEGAVLIAFGALVVAAILATTVATRRRRDASTNHE
jgi:hypothetical protein